MDRLGRYPFPGCRDVAGGRTFRVATKGLSLFLFPLLAACSQDGRIYTASTYGSVAAENAFVSPPPGGPAIVDVIERRYANATEQQIMLSTGSNATGQNFFRARVFGPVERDGAGITKLPRRSLSLTNVGAEMRSALPGVAMQRSPYYVQNRYGPFGYAIGRRGADLCLYGWQDLTETPRIGGYGGRVDIRLRLCRAGASEQQLLSVMYGYTINAYFNRPGWNPYGDPPAPPEGLGRPGTEMLPIGETRYETVLPREEEPVPARTAPRRAPAVAPQPVQPAPIGPLVPPPPVATGPEAVVPPPPNNAR